MPADLSNGKDMTSCGIATAREGNKMIEMVQNHAMAMK
jgi:hypothetical protein